MILPENIIQAAQNLSVAVTLQGELLKLTFDQSIWVVNLAILAELTIDDEYFHSIGYEGEAHLDGGMPPQAAYDILEAVFAKARELSIPN